MGLDNLIGITLTEQRLATNDAITSINNILKGKAVNLSPEERRQYGSIADRNKILVDKCKYYMEQNPDTTPPVIDKAEFDRDYATRKQIELPARELTRIIEKLQVLTTSRTSVDRHLHRCQQTVQKLSTPHSISINKHPYKFNK